MKIRNAVFGMRDLAEKGLITDSEPRIPYLTINEHFI